MFVHLLENSLGWIISIAAPLTVAIAWDGEPTEKERKSEPIFKVGNFPCSVCVDPCVTWANTASQVSHKLITLWIL